jgi:hypothetical protein
MSPVCRETGGVFTERKCPLGSLRLSKEMLNTVNHISRISKTLWDQKGLPKPLTLHFMSFPLPATIGEELVAVLSYLKSGNSSAFGFNQKPAWQKFELEWWQEQPASAGLEFRESSDTPSIYKAVTILKSNWSFHRLLKQAEVADDEVLGWKIERPEYPREFLTVQFATKSDPWVVFKLADE